MLDWAMARPAFKTQLFRFVDVFPALRSDADVARHLGEYFDGVEVPAGARPRHRRGRPRAVRPPRRGPRWPAATSSAWPQQFIVGATPDEAVAGLHRLWREGSAFTVDLLGEKTVVERRGRPLRGPGRPSWSTALAAASAGLGARRPPRARRPRARSPGSTSASSRPPSPPTTSRSPASVGLAGAKERLRPDPAAGPRARRVRHVDMEHYDVKDLTLALFRELLSEDEFADLPRRHRRPGLPAGQPRRPRRPDRLVGAPARPITVRLVKGAYWDAETVHARAEGWPVPVFEDKAETDANYERCVRLLHDHHGEVRAAFGSHNLRSLAYADHLRPPPGHPRHRLRDPDALRHGRADARRHPPPRAAPAGLRAGRRARAGHGVPRAAAAREHVERVVRAPPLRRGPGARRAARRRPTVDALPAPDAGPSRGRRPIPATPAPYRPEPRAEWRRPSARGRMAAAVAGDRRRPGRRRSRR